ncbi:MAG: DNA primase [Eubacteriaceae bacterium]|jgi:DNA primase|nr:DNA primase [Eubacteriaceae bacterium]
MATRLSNEFIQKVIDATDIVQIVSQHTALAKKSATYMGLCPFHSEKTPSFTVDAEKKLYYCFGCEKGGNAVGFVMDARKLSFREAVEYLASEANIPMERSEGGDSEAYRLREAILAMNRDAANFYYLSLRQAPQGKAYLEKRGVGEGAVRGFGLGFAPGNRRLAEHLGQIGYQEKDMLAASLVRKGERGLYDFFFGRVMFPIQDAAGKVVGFGGRNLDASLPKYLNTSDNIVFHKGECLYNLNSAKAKLDKSPLILVEGYMDVIALAEHGVATAAACLGTALTPAHARLILRYTQSVVLCYDADSAGSKAAQRGSDVLMEAGIEPKVLLLEEGEDPDSFVRKRGKESFLSALAGASSAIAFKIDMAAKGRDLSDIAQKSEFVRQAAAESAKISDEVRWDHYAKKISEMAGIDKNTAMRLIQSAWKGEASMEAQPIRVRAKASSETAELRLLAYFAKDRANFERFAKANGSESLFEGECKECYKEIVKFYDTKQNLLDITSSLMYNNRIAHTTSKFLSLPQGERFEEAEMLACMKTLIMAKYEKEMSSIMEQIRAAETDKDEQTAKSLMLKHSQMKKEMLEQKEGNA